MEKKKNGFIAISLIYSFFLVFLMTLLVIMTNYAHNRLLLNDVKKSIKNQLNSLSVIESFNLENKIYEPNAPVHYVKEDWLVVKDNGESVTLLLNRNLSNEEMEASFDQSLDVLSNDFIKMCSDKINPTYCYWENGSYEKYSWDKSLVKKVVDDWFNNNELLQRAYLRGKLNSMNFTDKTGSEVYPVNYSSYIRILTEEEAEIVKDNISYIWLLDLDKDYTGLNVKCFYDKSINGCISYVRENARLVRPVIEVKKLK